MNTLLVYSGTGAIEIDAQPGTLLVAYNYSDEPLPTSVTYQNAGGDQMNLPVGNTIYQVPVESFFIGYQMGNCPSITISWLWQ